MMARPPPWRGRRRAHMDITSEPNARKRVREGSRYAAWRAAARARAPHNETLCSPCGPLRGVIAHSICTVSTIFFLVCIAAIASATPWPVLVPVCSGARPPSDEPPTELPPDDLRRVVALGGAPGGAARWHRFSDSKVTEVSEEAVLAAQAFLLFYS
mmetsp:Transcript_46957/g.123753  ORF Transcript_46957/g.123753 Transcript_46957/m.123753 type:complete len:157 (-) Transcript_46957:140-610(-)